MQQIFSFLEKYGLYCLGGLVVLPFIVLSIFVHPVGTHGWDWATRHPGLGLPDYTFWEEQVYWYTTIVGRYSSNAMLSLTHYWFSITSFKFFPVLTIIALFSSLHYLLKSILLKTSSYRVSIITTTLAIIYFHQLSGPYEAFYNLSCILTYQTGAIFFFLMAGLGIRTLQKKKSFKNSILIGCLLFITIGTNEISLIAACAFWFLLLFGKYFHYKKWDKWLLSFFILALLFSFFEILAPGNFNRMEHSPNAKRVDLTIFLTLSVSIFNWARWLSSTTIIIFIILYVPLGIRLAKSQIVSKTFKYPWIALFGILSFQPVCLLLLFWSVGDEALPERVMDLIFITLLPCIFYFIQSLIQWSLNKNYFKKEFSLPSIAQYALFVFIFLNLFFNNLRIDKSEEARQTSNYLSIIQTDSNIGTAYLEILNGKAASYNQSQYKIYEVVNNSTIDTCLISYPTHFPKIIYDEAFDRKTRKGELWLGNYFKNKKVKLVKYNMKK